MNEKELLGLAKTGEGYTLDLKEKLPSDLGRHICAFANASGGKLILGLRDDATPSGYSLTNQDEARINSTARDLDSPVQVRIERVGSFAVIHVPESASKPHSSAGHFYPCVGSTSQQLKKDEIRDFFLKERLVRFDEKPNMDFDFARDFQKGKFRKYLKKARITPLPGYMDTLRNLSLLDGGWMKNAGVLFFSEGIKKFFISATISCVLYQGNEKVKILDMKEFDSDIVSNYENALLYLYSKLNTNFIIKKERTNRLELPDDALREALINAIVHRDYFSTGHVQVDIYLDRVEISNPGGLVSGLSRKDLGKVSMPRNPLLMDLFLRIDSVEKAGTGIRRIRDAMKKYGLSPRIHADGNWFFMTFPRTPQVTPQKTPQKNLTALEEKVLAKIKTKPKITRVGIAEALGISQDTAKEYIERLKAKGVLKRIGGDKFGYWETGGG